MSHKNLVQIQLIHPMMYGWFEYGVGWHEVDEDLANYFLERKPSSARLYVDGSETKQGSISPTPRTAADDPEDIIRDIGLITEEIGRYEQKIRASHRHPEHRPEYVTQIAALRSERARLKALLELHRAQTAEKPLLQGNEREPPKPTTFRDNSIIAGTTESAKRTERPRRVRRSTKVPSIPGKDRVEWYRSLHKWKDEEGASVIDKTTGRLNYSYANLYETIFVEIAGKWSVPQSCDWDTHRTSSCARAWDEGDSSRRKKMRDWVRRLVNDCSPFRHRVIGSR